LREQRLVVKTSTRGRKAPPKTFDTLKEARIALMDLADSLANHQFQWPAAAIRSYLSGGSQSLDEAFGFAAAAAAKAKAKSSKPSPAKTKAAAPSKRGRLKR
jgi:hypothetical protein